MNKLAIFLDWRSRAKQRLQETGFSVSFFDAPLSQNNSASLRFNNNAIEAVIMVWEHGDIHAEAFDHTNNDFLPISKVAEEGVRVDHILDAYLHAILTLAEEGKQ